MKYQYLTLLTLVIQNTASIVLTRVSRTSFKNDDEYSTSIAVILDELIKLVFCFLILFIAYKKEEKQEESFIHFLRLNAFKLQPFLHMAIPAICFAIQKNLTFVAISNLEAATFQVASQGKILTTAFFSYLILSISLNRRQIFSLLLLIGGVCMVQFEVNQTEQSVSSNKGHDDPVIGFMSVSGVCISSGFASVYFEWIVKKGSSGTISSGKWYDIWIQNFQLSLLTVIPASIPIFMNKADMMNPLRGFNMLVWFVVCLQSAGGLLVALVIKYADNILKNFATGIAIISSLVVSSIFLGFKVTPVFIIGTCIVILSVYFYTEATPLTPSEEVPTVVVKSGKIFNDQELGPIE
jgi:UDP-sugar transporter A1/2/3